MHVRFLDDCRERPLGLPTRLKERGEVTSVADPRYLQLHRPHPRVPGTLAVAVALPHASGTALVTPSSYVLLDLHLHEGLGEHPHALLEEVRVLIDHRLAQQLREPYPQLIGHRVLRFGRLVSSEGTTRWPSSSTARSLFTHSRGHYHFPPAAICHDARVRIEYRLDVMGVTQIIVTPKKRSGLDGRYARSGVCWGPGGRCGPGAWMGTRLRILLVE